MEVVPLYALPFELNAMHTAGATTISLRGEIDFAAAIELTPELDKIVESCESELLFDLRGVTFIDSEGLKMILKAFDRMQRKGCIARIISLSDRARRVIDIAGMSTILGCTEQCEQTNSRQVFWQIRDLWHSQQQ